MNFEGMTIQIKVIDIKKYIFYFAGTLYLYVALFNLN